MSGLGLDQSTHVQAIDKHPSHPRQHRFGAGCHSFFMTHQLTNAISAILMFTAAELPSVGISNSSYSFLNL